MRPALGNKRSIMKPQLIFLVLLLLAPGTNAKRLTIVNKTDNKLQVVLIPQGVPLNSNKAKLKRALRHRFAFLDVGESARLRCDGIESIDIKVVNKTDKAKIGINMTVFMR